MMEQSAFQLPSSGDYQNVRTLNEAWLGATTDLPPGERRTLSTTPFLLFSVRERDSEWWLGALACQPDLLRDTREISGPVRRLQAAAIGFLWHLAGRNPYAARLVSGASVEWCETITAHPLITVIERTAERADLTRSRLSPVGSANRLEQLAALQSLLTQSEPTPQQALPAAACHMHGPSSRVQYAADERPHDKQSKQDLRKR